MGGHLSVPIRVFLLKRHARKNIENPHKFLLHNLHIDTVELFPGFKIF